MEPFQRLNRSILPDDPLDPLNQLLAIGLHSLRLAYARLVAFRIHRNLCTCRPIMQKTCRNRQSFSVIILPSRASGCL